MRVCAPNYTVRWWVILAFLSPKETESHSIPWLKCGHVQPKSMGKSYWPSGLWGSSWGRNIWVEMGGWWGDRYTSYLGCPRATSLLGQGCGLVLAHGGKKSPGTLSGFGMLTSHTWSPLHRRISMIPLHLLPKYHRIPVTGNIQCLTQTWHLRRNWVFGQTDFIWNHQLTPHTSKIRFWRALETELKCLHSYEQLFNKTFFMFPLHVNISIWHLYKNSENGAKVSFSLRKPLTKNIHTSLKFRKMVLSKLH